MGWCCNSRLTGPKSDSRHDSPTIRPSEWQPVSRAETSSTSARRGSGMRRSGVYRHAWSRPARATIRTGSRPAPRAIPRYLVSDALRTRTVMGLPREWVGASVVSVVKWQIVARSVKGAAARLSHNRLRRANDSGAGRTPQSGDSLGQSHSHV
ncbi:hypothetical protein CBM2615_B130013 [Cupriavidus taiwanensis]|uniref:Uncharacterized protein n=1 Tax=Cupriavidus taiwanensis TaxID=164546 RepID=A0A976G426_9BURK|nr:hypothetical protein CBM2615_B130013 [Cupriavidus taiwanensis]SOZ67482.1 hypothetical protein CBM2613_B100013 [Cupriavidus taiwanensis]